MIYTVFSTTNNPYMNWQSELLEHSWKEVGQPGELIRLVATADRGQLPSSRDAKIIPTWPWDIHPLTGDHYLIYNKPASLSQWLTIHKPEGTVLFIDPDCVFRAPIHQEVSEGYPVSQSWIDFRPEAIYHPPNQGPPFDLIDRYCKKNRELVRGVMIPTLIHTSDLKRLAPRWLELTAQIRQGVRNREGMPLWESDMFGYIIAAAECGLVHEPANLGICTNWSPTDVPNAPIIHYCQAIRSKNEDIIWNKRSYTPWEKVPDPGLAKDDYGQDLLKMINRFLNTKNSPTAVSRAKQPIKISDQPSLQCLKPLEPNKNSALVSFHQHPTLNDSTIFVSIASYCDPELPRTLDDCLRTAKYPKNLRFGICWQFDRNQSVDIEKFKKDDRFQFVEYPIEESQGGTWARHKAQKFWDEEPYTLQIDSHMKFEPNWDVKLIQMMKTLPSQKPLITANSPVFWNDEHGKLHRDTRRGVPTHKIVDWNPKMGWTIWADYGKPNTQWPGRTRILTGNFVFTLGKWNQEVPQDPGHYYWGEEWSLTIRSFTHGYDLFLPEEIVIWHMLHRNGPPRRHWEQGTDIVNRKNEVAFDRLRMLIYSDDERDQQRLGIYGLGTVRTKREYEIFAGMDFKTKKAHPNVYAGINPNPVTIKSESDWNKCLTFEEYKNRDWGTSRKGKI